jgi:hypothetical protein
MTREEVLEKFRNNARPAIGAERCERLIGKLEQLETVGDVRELGEMMIPPANLDISPAVG